MDLGLAAARQYGATRPLTAPDPGGATTDLGRAAEGFLDTLRRAESLATDSMTATGADRPDPHALVAALSEAQLAVEAVVAVRDRVVEAYLEILRMPV
jgi:flagellar hook-basal body complex protein FliE